VSQAALLSPPAGVSPEFYSHFLACLRMAGMPLHGPLFRRGVERYEFDPHEPRDARGRWTAEPGGEVAGEERLQGWAAQAGRLPAAVAAKVRDLAAAQFRRLEARYGRKGAVAVMAGMAALLPVPVPGASLVPVALAEAVLAARKLLGGAAQAAEGYAAEGGLDPEELAREIREWAAEVAEALGEPPPDWADEEIAKALRQDRAAGPERLSRAGDAALPAFRAFLAGRGVRGADDADLAAALAEAGRRRREEYADLWEVLNELPMGQPAPRR
jgi:hypothetical protein